MSFSRYGRSNPIAQSILAGAFIWAAMQSGALMVGGAIQPLTACLYFFASLSAINALGSYFEFAADGLDWIASHSGSGKSGTSRWGKFKDVRKEMNKTDEGPFWGMSAKGKKKLLADFVSNAYVVGPAGSGKGHTEVVPLIFLIRHSKIIMDFKPELLCICKKGLEKLGQQVLALNPFGMYTDRVGDGESLNFLDIITDDLFRPGGLRSVFSDAGEFSMQLYEDKPSSNTDPYWPNGTRKLISLGNITECMVNGYDATLTNVARLLDDPGKLELRLCSIVGEDLEGNPDPQGPYLFEMSEWAQNQSNEDLDEFLKSVRAKASGMLKQMRSVDKGFPSFLEGAQQALAPFGFGELSSAMVKTTVNFDEIKNGDEIINWFIVGDASRKVATEKYFGMAQWYMQLKLKRHENKHVPVYLINDEINNTSIFGYLSLLSWGRGFGIRTINFLQSFAAFEERYGRNATEVLNSESEIKLFLPGQRSSSTIRKIVELLGQQSLMVASLSKDKKEPGLNENLSESARPLMTEDEVRRSKHGILIIRDNLPLLQQPVSYSEIKPFRTLADINPHHGKPFLNKVKLKLKLPKVGGKRK